MNPSLGTPTSLHLPWRCWGRLPPAHGGTGVPAFSSARYRCTAARKRGNWSIGAPRRRTRGHRVSIMLPSACLRPYLDLPYPAAVAGPPYPCGAAGMRHQDTSGGLVDSKGMANCVFSPRLWNNACLSITAGHVVSRGSSNYPRVITACGDRPRLLASRLAATLLRLWITRRTLGTTCQLWSSFSLQWPESSSSSSETTATWPALLSGPAGHM